MSNGTKIGLGQSYLEVVRNLKKADKAAKGSMNALSSGKKSNLDSAAVAIATKMSSRIISLAATQQNLSTAHSTLSVVEGAQGQSGELLGRARELAVQAANDTLSASDRSAIQQEFEQIKSQLNHVADTTEFNGINLMSENKTLSFQTGADAGDTMKVELEAATTDALNLNDVSLGDSASASTAIGALDQAIGVLGSQRAAIGAAQNRLGSIAEINAVAEENSRAARSMVFDADFARETAELARNMIKRNAGLALQAQANSNANFVLPLLNVVKSG